LAHQEVAELKAQLDAVGDGDTWKAACKRLEARVEEMEIAAGIDAVSWFNMRKELTNDNTRLRGLLREVKNGYGLTASWWNRVTAALEVKP